MKNKTDNTANKPTYSELMALYAKLKSIEAKEHEALFRLQYLGLINGFGE